MLRPVTGLVALAACVPLPAHEPITTRLTWNREIVRIVTRRCSNCHREGGSAPMPLATYADARPWAKAIKEEVLERRMPPWSAVKGFGDFAGDAGLSQEEIGILADWVEGGAPEGDPRDLPSMPRMPKEVPAADGSALRIRSALTLRRNAVVTGIRPERIPEGQSIQVTAVRADGSVEPLLWLRNYNPKWRRTFAYREPLRFEAGTRIRVSPAGIGSVPLIVK